MTKVNITEEQCMKMAELEGDSEIGAGLHPIIVPCEACQGEGRTLTNNGGPDDTDHGVCPECNGDRVIEVDTNPVELDDPLHSEVRHFKTRTGKDRTMLMRPGRFPDYR